MRLGCVAFVILFLRRCLGAELIQSPMSITQNEGKTARMTCNLGTANTDYIHWYRQPDGQRPVRILYYNNGANVRDDGFDNRFTARKAGEKQYSLTVTRLKKEDSGTYYCAYWATSGTWRKIFGGGTRLFVTNQALRGPTVHLLQPDSDDKRKDKFFVACLMTNFFPEVIKVDWKFTASNPARKILTEPVKKGNNSYSLISRAEVSRDEWDGGNITCVATHEAGTVVVSTSPAARRATPKTDNVAGSNCRFIGEDLTNIPDKATPYASLRVATLTYTALLTKSVLYCFLISFIVFKMESRGAKKST